MRRAAPATPESQKKVLTVPGLATTTSKEDQSDDLGDVPPLVSRKHDQQISKGCPNLLSCHKSKMPTII